MINFKDQKGQTLIEAVVALVTILLIITAIAIVIASGLSNSSFTKNQTEAGKFAQQGIETVKNIQENNLTTFKSYATSPSTYCVDDANSQLYTVGCANTGVNTGNSYNRTISFNSASQECNNTMVESEVTEVSVVVKWSSTKCPPTNTFCHESKLTTCMPYKGPASNP